MGCIRISTAFTRPFLFVRCHVLPSLSEISPPLTASRCSRWSGSGLSNTAGVTRRNRKAKEIRKWGNFKKVSLIFTSAGQRSIRDRSTVVKVLLWWPEGGEVKSQDFKRWGGRHIIWCHSTPTPDSALRRGRKTLYFRRAQMLAISFPYSLARLTFRNK